LEKNTKKGLNENEKQEIEHYLIFNKMIGLAKASAIRIKFFLKLRLIDRLKTKNYEL
jgi:hypothetical protein